MTHNFYVVFDTVANDTFTSFTAVNDGMAVRDNLPALSRIRPVQDLVLYCVGSFDTVSMDVVSVPRRLVSWDSYKFPESNGVASPVSTSMLKNNK